MKDREDERDEETVLCPLCGEYVDENDYNWLKEMCNDCEERLEK